MTIAQWLQQDKRDYAQGVILFERFGGDASTLSLFKSGKNSLTRTMLFDELTELNARLTSSPKKTVKDPPKKVELPTKAEYHKDIAPIYQLKEISFKEMTALKQQLKHMASDAERFEAILRIDELDLTVDDCWDKINYFNEHGCLPAEEEEFSLQTIRDVVSQSKNIPTYISKIDAKLKGEKIAEEDRPDLIAKKIRLKLHLDKIEKILDLPLNL